MKSVFLLTLIVCFLVSCKKSDPEGTVLPSSANYTLVWADEFDYTGLPDETKWEYETGYSRNKEAQYYMPANLENSRVGNGVLKITARYNVNDSQHPITSASLITKDKKHFLFGRLEMRAKMPKGKGAWPAFWTLGINRNEVGWPSCGEIDIMEWLGFLPKYVFGSLHLANSEKQDWPIISPHLASSNPEDLSSTYHVYAIEWDSGQISFFFDSELYATIKSKNFQPNEWAQFTKPHYMLLNLALGGTSGGQIDQESYPFEYTIDYVRYYKPN